MYTICRCFHTSLIFFKAEEDFAPFKESMTLYLKKNLTPFYSMMLCAKFNWNWLIGSWEEVENIKSIQTERKTDGRTDGRRKKWSEKLTWAFRLGELKTCSGWIILLIECQIYQVALNTKFILMSFCSIWVDFNCVDNFNRH